MRTSFSLRFIGLLGLAACSVNAKVRAGASASTDDRNNASPPPASTPPRRGHGKASAATTCVGLPGVVLRRAGR